MLRPNSSLVINNRLICNDQPTYFIADIAANHDGDLERARALIHLAAESGAEAAKFQHFKAETIVSDSGFRALGGQYSHQAKWSKTVYEVYKAASVNLSWTPILKETCDEAGIAFFSSPYSLDLVDHIDPFVPAFKIGSGDITWTEIICHIANKQKPYILASGASSMDDVQRAVDLALSINPQLALLQCNTNYTANHENFKFINLYVLKTYREMYPEIILGLSDHTPGHTTVLGAITLGARIIEKHFTDDTDRNGPDHAFSMNPVTWREMIDRSRELENAIGSGCKRIQGNELETVVLQRRAVRLTRHINPGEKITLADLTVLRPCPEDGLPPYEIKNVIGRTIRHSLTAGQHLKWTDLD